MTEVVAHIIQPRDWVQITISVCSILTSIVAVIISITTYKSQVEHNKNSVRPIIDIIFGDYEDDIYVRIDNNGVGPAIIKGVLCLNGQKKADSLIKLIPQKARLTTPYCDESIKLSPFSDFVENISGRTLAPGGHITLLQLSNPDPKKRTILRYILKDIALQVEYTDIYKKETMNTQRELSFFGRTLSKSATLKVTY